jgi:glycosyltransferase involved in cell wall biosynthesis
MTPLRILQVSTSDLAGGAERSAKNLADEFRAMGHESWLAVGYKRGRDPYTFEIPNEASRNALYKAFDSARNAKGLRRIASLGRRIAEPIRSIDVERGREDFEFPGTEKLLELTPSKPDIVHVHNLHGGYFDLRVLPELSRRIPTILNIRDAWLMSGHCAFSLDCERWLTGCGDCPDLSLFPAVKRDATAFNWQRKRDILRNSRVYVTTASQWMMDRVNQSIVAAAAIEERVIPNGVDTRVFFPGDRAAARNATGIDQDARVLLAAANGLRNNVWKDYKTLRAALEILSDQKLVVVAVGENAPTEKIGKIELRFVPFESDPARLADYYRAADVYLHAARVESFGNVLLEARACGTPIVTTATGGIPEQVPEGTGMLVPQGDARAFAAAIEKLLSDESLREQIAANGERHVREHYTLRLQAERFIDWYREILHD